MAGFERATSLLTSHRGLLERVARAWLERETSDAAALRSLTTMNRAR